MSNTPNIPIQALEQAVDQLALEILRRATERARRLISVPLDGYPASPPDTPHAEMVAMAREAMERANGDHAKAAQALGVPLSTLGRYLGPLHRLSSEPALKKLRREAAHEAVSKPSKRVRFVKRADGGKLRERLVEFIAGNPGKSSEELMPHVRPANVKPGAVQRVLHLLVSEGVLTTTGVARGTRYTLAKKAPKVGLGPSKNVPQTAAKAKKEKKAS